MVFIRKGKHEIIRVEDKEGDHREICKCQLKEKFVNDDGSVSFPVYECPRMTHRYGYGTEEGL